MLTSGAEEAQDAATEEDHRAKQTTVLEQEMDGPQPAKPPRLSTLWRLTALYFAVRTVLLIADVLVAHQSYSGRLAGPLLSWDSHFYILIAQHGYPATVLRSGGSLTYSPAAFPPGLPLLIRLLAITGTPYVGAAIEVSVLCGWATTLLMWQIGSDVGGDRLGYNSATLLAVFPGMGVAWGLIYSEAPGAMFVAASLLMLMRRRWLLAGLAGAAATLCSPVALALVVPALYLVVRDLRHKKPSGALVSATLTPLGFVGFALWDGIRYHDLLYYWHLQHDAWGVSVDFGRGLVGLLGHLWAAGYQGPAWLEWTAVVAVALTIVAMLKAKLPAVLNFYIGASLLGLFCSNQGLKPRLLVWAFPALIAVARSVRAPSLRTLTVGFAMLMPMVFMAFTTLGNTMVQP